jgi:small subunit ribosomal protein S2
LAVNEANKLGIPVIGVVDTNANPEKVTYPIPANDDAIKSLQILLDYAVQSVQEGAAKDKTETNQKQEVKA